MLTALVLLGVMLAGAATAVLVKYRAFRATEAQFVQAPQIPGCRVACSPPMTPERFGTALLKARDLLIATGLYSAAAVQHALSTSTNVVMRSMSWADRAGRLVGGSTEWAGITVASDLSSTFHELLHLVDWRETGAALDEGPTWARAGLREADEAFRGWLKENP